MAIGEQFLKTTFHYGRDNIAVLDQVRDTEEFEFTYALDNFFHPYVGELLERLTRAGIPGMLDRAFLTALRDDQLFADTYADVGGAFVELQPSPARIEVDPLSAPMRWANTELLLHLPLAIAVHLSKNQRFAEAHRWFHTIFDPASADGPWRYLGFSEASAGQDIEQLLAILTAPDDELDADGKAAKRSILDGVRALAESPFQPHAVARTRPVAYQYHVVMKYVDNLIAWGDSLFLQDTIETINEAQLRYTLAKELLGPRPERVPAIGAPAARTFAQLRDRLAQASGNAFVELEPEFPLTAVLPSDGGGDGWHALFGLARTLYFCVPRNEKLLGLWDTVDDRLYKIRHCLNIEGVFRKLALFDPPLDPALMVKLGGAGIDMASVLAAMGQPLGPLRALPMIERARALAVEVRALGAAMLQAVEKGDAEHLARLRQTHELRLLELTQDVRFLQWKQAQEGMEVLQRTRASAMERYRYHLRLMGLTPNGSATPETLPLSSAAITEENFDEVYAALVEDYDRTIPATAYPKLKLASASPSIVAGAQANGPLYLTSNEHSELNTHLPLARDGRLLSSVGDGIAAVLSSVPDFRVHTHYWGIGVSSGITGGNKLSTAVKYGAELLRTLSAWEQDQAGIAARTAGYERRADEWRLQANLAARELTGIGRQLIAAKIAEQAAHREYEHVRTQITQAGEVDDFLHEKFSSEELYTWMRSELSRLHYAYYRFALDTARRAERTMQAELMRPELDAGFVRANYWDAGRKGLLAGEQLEFDLRRMEAAYHDANRRERELRCHVSLRQLDPVALLTLRSGNACEFTMPEWLFDRDCPGTYLRRIKSMSISIHGVAGPYTSVHAALTLLSSSMRTTPSVDPGYARTDDRPDGRFVDTLGVGQSIVTSTGTHDSGMFETNLRDERFLPFEGAGAESRWRVEFPATAATFDRSLITDVVLHCLYTARDGGPELMIAARDDVSRRLNDLTASHLGLLLSLPHDFPSEWAAFRADKAIDLPLRKDLFPYLAQSGDLTVKSLELVGADVRAPRAVSVPDKMSEELNAKPEGSLLHIAADNKVLTADAGEVFLIIRYEVTLP